MTCPWCRVFVVTVVAVTDVAVYIYNMTVVGSSGGGQPVSYAAHLAGALTGLLVGITCLKNLRWETHERYVWAVSATVFILLIGSAVVFSIAYPSWFVGISPEIRSHMTNCTFHLYLANWVFYTLQKSEIDSPHQGRPILHSFQSETLPHHH